MPVTWPMLAKPVIAPNGHRVETTHHATRALPLTSTHVAPYGQGSVTTTYSWHATWNKPLTVVGPTGESMTYTYASTAPNVLTQQDGRGDSTRAYFTYTSGNQLETIKTPEQYAHGISWLCVLRA
ncbi:MAG: hypothetical protein V4550_17615 [Gemmatimonadota bacterium]